MRLQSLQKSRILYANCFELDFFPRIFFPEKIRPKCYEHVSMVYNALCVWNIDHGSKYLHIRISLCSIWTSRNWSWIADITKSRFSSDTDAIILVAEVDSCNSVKIFMQNQIKPPNFPGPWPTFGLGQEVVILESTYLKRENNWSDLEQKVSSIRK